MKRTVHAMLYHWYTVEEMPMEYPCVYIGRLGYPIAKTYPMSKWEIQGAKIKKWMKIKLPEPD